MFEFSCPQCSESVKAAEDQAGEAILCPKCHEAIKVPGERRQPNDKSTDDWSVFDEEEKFIEESVAKQPQAQYRTPEDDREAIVDDDEAAAKQEELEEKMAANEAMAKAKGFETSFDLAGTSDLTVEEKMEMEAKFQEELDSLPPDSPLRKKKSWDREAGNTPDSIQLENQPKSSNSIGVKCAVCESVTLVSKSKAGSSIICSDCGSPIDVPKEADSAEPRKLQEWEKWAQKEKMESEKKQKSKIADELFVVPPEDDDSGYGLAPSAENLLTPVTPIYDESDLEEEQAESGLAPQSEQGKKQEPSELETSELFEEMEAEKKRIKFERLPWAQHIFSLLSDPGFLIRALVSAAVMIVGFSIYYFPQGLAAMEGDRMAMVASFLGKFMQMWAFPFLPLGFLMFSWVGQKVLNATIVGEKKLPDIEGSTLVEWFSNSLFVAVGLGLGAFPGALLGGLIWFQVSESHGFWAVPAAGTMSAMLVGPLVILSSLENRSPFKIFSKKISESITKKTDAWIEFYFGALAMAVITGALWCLAMTDIWVVAVLMFLLVNLCFGLYFRMLGRLMGTILQKKKQDKPAGENPTDENPAEATPAKNESQDA